MDSFIIGFIVLFGIIIVSRIILTKAMNKLSSEQKGQLIDVFKTQGLWNLAIVLMIFLAFYISRKFDFIDTQMSYVIFAFAIIIMSLSNTYMAFKKLKEMDFDKNYISKFLLTSAIKIIAICFFFLMVIISGVNPTN